MQSVFQWLYDTPVATAIREGSVLFPWIESTHVLAIVTVVGSMIVVDLRLLGVAWKNRPISRVTDEMLPITWVAFVFAVITGSLLFSSNAVKYSHNIFFLSKMSLLVVAFVNMLVFHFVTGRDMQHWDEAPNVPPAARLAGGVSLAVWIGVVVCARWIGFTIGAF